MTTSPLKTRAVAGIIRVSTDSAEQAQSPENQREHLARAGCTEFYEDKISGSAEGGERRRLSPVWQRLITDIEAGRISKLMCCEVNRIARRDHLIMDLVALCDQHAVEFIATTGGQLSAKSAPQWLSVKQQAVFAEYFAREQSDKIKRGQESCRQRGVFGFTSAHLAWHLQKDPTDKRKVIAKPEAWDDARTAVIEYLNGNWTMSEMCSFLHDRQGVLSRPGVAHKWLKSGWIRGHYASRQTGEIYIANLAPALLSEEEHERLLLRLAANRKRPGTRAPHKIRALSKVCRCFHCRSLLTYSVSKQRYSYLRCGNNQCEAYAKNVPSMAVEADLQVAIDSRVGEIINSDQQRAQQVRPSKELLNLRQRTKQLRAVLDVMESPGVRADYDEAMARQQQLEEALEPSEPTERSMAQILYEGSVNWWADKTDAERQSAYLLLIDFAVISTLGTVPVRVGPESVNDSNVIGIYWRGEGPKL